MFHWSVKVKYVRFDMPKMYKCCATDISTILAMSVSTFHFQFRLFFFVFCCFFHQIRRFRATYPASTTSFYQRPNSGFTVIGVGRHKRFDVCVLWE